jgi:uncharacterized membrane protein
MGEYIFPLIFSSIIFGTAPILDKLGLQSTKYKNSKEYYIYRMIGLGISLIITMLIYGSLNGSLNGVNYKNTLEFKRKTIAFLVITSILNAIGLMYYIKGIDKTPSTNINVILGTGISLFTAIILSYIFLNQPINIKVKFSLSIIVIGIFLTLYFSN